MHQQTDHRNSSVPEERDRRILFLMVLVVLLLFFCYPEISKVNRDTIESDEAHLAWSNNRLVLQSQAEKPLQSNRLPAVVSLFISGKIPINSADEELLTTIKGIGPKLSATIIGYRKTNGQFKEPADLLKVKGIGKKRKEMFQEQLSFD